MKQNIEYNIILYSTQKSKNWECDGPKGSVKMLIPIDCNKSHMYIVMPKAMSIKLLEIL